MGVFEGVVPVLPNHVKIFVSQIFTDIKETNTLA